MDCNQTRPLIAAHLDGELDVIRDAEVVAHLDRCPACADAALAHAASRGLIQEKLPRYNAPSDLHGDICKALRAESKPAAQHKMPPFLFKSMGLAASLAFAVLVGFHWGNTRSNANHLIDEAVSDHIRSLQADHLTDVTSTDQHTVKPWFAGKLDFAPPVIDLASAGFPLGGGRLEHLDNQPAAALVFHRRQHAINLYIWPVCTTTLSPRMTERIGYHIEAWSRNGFNFLAVSEIPAVELAQFAEAFRSSQRE
jgi:anti-sigma factor RsiW